MHREFTYTKSRLIFILESLLEKDIRDSYQTVETAEEGFEKRAAIVFLLWFLEESFPDGFTFKCDFDRLGDDYGPELAKAIVEGKGWAARQVRELDGGSGNVMHVDFKN